MKKLVPMFKCFLSIFIMSAFFISSCKKNSTADIQQKKADPTSKSIPTINLTAIRDAAIKTKMITSFQSLKVNLSLLSSTLGLSYKLDSKDIDFDNLSRSHVTNDNEVGEAIVAPFKGNSTSNLSNYVFCLTVGADSVYKPYIVQATTNQLLKYFDLNKGNILTVDNYHNQNTLSVRTTMGDYLNGSATGSRGCGQATMDCITDAYSNHGWTSVWATVQSIFVPWTGAAIAGACAAKNCTAKR
jgi:hypothetical protein